MAREWNSSEVGRSGSDRIGPVSALDSIGVAILGFLGFTRNIVDSMSAYCRELYVDYPYNIMIM